MEGKLILPKVAQVALTVNDLQATAAFLSETLGIGPFQLSERISSTKLNGKDIKARRKIGTAKMGGIDLELIEAPEPNSPYYKFVHTRGEGLQHIAFTPIEDLDKMVAYLKGKGYKAVYAGEYEGNRFAYMESDKAKGLILEFVQQLNT